ncbi:FAD binding domain protein [Diaporthe sp. PMI_573]|nr:FAD binding domain protein [Diaporthaceae sp. PMI_573]
MRVVIVGGGLAGLALASALEKANVDFILLEARSRIDPQVGASIGLNAAALRILDQLGAAQDIIKHCAPVKLSKVHRSDGLLLMPPAFTFPILILNIEPTRFGYGAAFLDRHTVLQAIASTIAQKDKIMLNSTVLSIDHTDSGVTVNCEDGSSYYGDVVVGCDGVNSKSSVCREMFCLASKDDAALFPEKEQMKMTAEYNYLFGISGPIKGLNVGKVNTTFDMGRSILIITGKNGTIYWFYRERLDKLYRVGDPDFPRYSEADIKNLVHKNAWRYVSETVTLGDLWKHRLSCTLAGNNAIESAAALANELKKIHDGGLATPQVIRSALQRWQEKRWARVHATVKEAAVMCRMQALDSPMASFIMNYVVPNVTKLLLTVVTNTVIGAEILEYLPVPRQSLEGTCPFNPNQGTGKLASTSGIGHSLDQFLQLGQQLTNSDERVEWLQNLQVLIYGSLLPTVFYGLSLRFGMGAISPFYYFLHYVFSPIEKFAADDARLTNLGYTRIILPLTLLLISWPIFLATAGYPAADLTSTWRLSWILKPPFIIAIVQWILVKARISKDSMHEDSMGNQKRDLPYIRGCVYTLSTISAMTWISAHLSSSPLISLWSGGILEPNSVGVVFSSLFWVGLLIYDVKNAGMVNNKWVKVLTIGFAVSLFAGPLVAVALGWMWREEVLASKRERHAITSERYEGKSILEVHNSASFAAGEDGFGKLETS